MKNRTAGTGSRVWVHVLRYYYRTCFFGVSYYYIGKVNETQHLVDILGGNYMRNLPPSPTPPHTHPIEIVLKYMISTYQSSCVLARRAFAVSSPRATATFAGNCADCRRFVRRRQTVWHCAARLRRPCCCWWRRRRCSAPWLFGTLFDQSNGIVSQAWNEIWKNKQNYNVNILSETRPFAF